MFTHIVQGYPDRVTTPEGRTAMSADSESWQDEPGFEVRVDTTGGAGESALLTLTGELDSLAAGQLSECLGKVDAQAPGLVLDMQGVSFIDSSGLRTLIQARQMFPDDPAALTLRKPQPSTTRLLELTGLADYFSLAT
jgi:anti-anti-sigma factor